MLPGMVTQLQAFPMEITYQIHQRMCTPSFYSLKCFNFPPSRRALTALSTLSLRLSTQAVLRTLRIYHHTAIVKMGAIARTFGLLLPALLFTQAAAQIQFTNSHYDGIVEGQPFNLTFAGDGSVSATSSRSVPQILLPPTQHQSEQNPLTPFFNHTGRDNFTQTGSGDQPSNHQHHRL